MEGKELLRLADEFHKERLMLDDMRRREAMISADINQKQLANNEVARMANAQQEEVRIEAESYRWLMNVHYKSVLHLQHTVRSFKMN